jgi:hypothetical protein
MHLARALSLLSLASTPASKGASTPVKRTLSLPGNQLSQVFVEANNKLTELNNVTSLPAIRLSKKQKIHHEVASGGVSNCDSTQQLGKSSLVNKQSSGSVYRSHGTKRRNWRAKWSHAQIKQFSEGEIDLLNEILAIDDPAEQAHILALLGTQIEHLDSAVRTKVLDAILDIPGGSACITALRCAAANIIDLRKADAERLHSVIKAACFFPTARAKMLSAVIGAINKKLTSLLQRHTALSLVFEESYVTQTKRLRLASTGLP